jgi:nitrite reductase (NADH) large subunit
MQQKLIVIGSGMVGSRLIERVLAESPNHYDIRVFNKEPTGGYNRLMLSPVLAGEKTISEIMTHDQDWFRSRSIKLHTGTEISKIDTQKKTVKTLNGESYDYDKLVIATGSSPFILPIEGHQLPGVVAFRDIRDVNCMISSSKSQKNAVVIGGGLLGLEAANGLMKLGMKVTVLHRENILMNVQMDAISGGLLKTAMEESGIYFEMQANTVRILGDEFVTGIELDSGKIIDADLVVMAVGIRPNTGLAKLTGLEVNRGIVVDDQLKTSIKDVYALGECVEHRGALYGLVAPLYEQAEVLAKELADIDSAYQGSFTSTKLKVTGISLFSAGDFHENEGSEALVYQDYEKRIYRKIVLKDNKIQGAVMYGDVSGSNWIFENLVSQTDMSAYRDTLVFGDGFQPANKKIA